MSCLFGPVFSFFRHLSPSPLAVRQGESRNVLVLGSLGVGKSSLINMFIGRPVAPVSSGIGIVHPAIVGYPIPLREISSEKASPPTSSSHDPAVTFYDTVGLEHRPAPLRAIKACMQRSGGADVLVYCVRRGRLSKDQVAHLRTIWKTFCQEGVPLLLVVSGVEYRRGSIEKWWEVNGEHLETTAQVKFAEHVCLNTWDPAHASWKHQSMGYEETQKLVREFVIRHCMRRRSAS